jgi:hypothetical protein
VCRFRDHICGAHGSIDSRDADRSLPCPHHVVGQISGPNAFVARTVLDEVYLAVAFLVVELPVRYARID